MSQEVESPFDPDAFFANIENENPFYRLPSSGLLVPAPRTPSPKQADEVRRTGPSVSPSALDDAGVSQNSSVVETSVISYPTEQIRLTETGEGWRQSSARTGPATDLFSPLLLEQIFSDQPAETTPTAPHSRVQPPSSLRREVPPPTSTSSSDAQLQSSNDGLLTPTRMDHGESPSTASALSLTSVRRSLVYKSTPGSSVASIEPHGQDYLGPLNMQQLLQPQYDSTTQNQLMALIQGMDATAVDGPSVAPKQTSPSLISTKRPIPKAIPSTRRVAFDDPPTSSVHRYAPDLSLNNSSHRANSQRRVGTTSRAGVPSVKQIFKEAVSVTENIADHSQTKENDEPQVDRTLSVNGRPTHSSTSSSFPLSGSSQNSNSRASATRMTESIPYPSDIDSLSSFTASRVDEWKTGTSDESIQTFQRVPSDYQPQREIIRKGELGVVHLGKVAKTEGPSSCVTSPGKPTSPDTPSLSHRPLRKYPRLPLHDKPQDQPQSAVSSNSPPLVTSSRPRRSPDPNERFTPKLPARDEPTKASGTPKSETTRVIISAAMTPVQTPAIQMITPHNLGGALRERVGDMWFDKKQCRWVRIKDRAKVTNPAELPAVTNVREMAPTSLKTLPVSETRQGKQCAPPSQGIQRAPPASNDSYPSLFCRPPTDVHLVQPTNDSLPWGETKLIVTPRPADFGLEYSDDSPDPFRGIDDLQSSEEELDHPNQPRFRNDPCKSRPPQESSPAPPCMSTGGYQSPDSATSPTSHPLTSSPPRSSPQPTRTPSRGMFSTPKNLTLPQTDQGMSQVLSVDTQSQLVHIKTMTTTSHPGHHTLSLSSMRKRLQLQELAVPRTEPSPITLQEGQVVLPSLFNCPTGPVWDLSRRHLVSLAKLEPWANVVEELDVSHNCLETVDMNLPNLTRLTIPHNRLSQLPRGLAQSWCHLEAVDVSFNLLTSLDSLSGLKHLRTLVANHNQLTTLAGLRGLPRLERLSVRSNQIESIDLQPDQTPRLLQLDLARNRVTSLTHVDEFEQLRLLNLDGNQLRCVHIQRPLSRLQILRISDNPLLGCVAPATHVEGTSLLTDCPYVAQPASPAVISPTTSMSSACGWQACRFSWAYWFPHLTTFYADDSHLTVFTCSPFTGTCPVNPDHTARHPTFAYPLDSPLVWSRIRNLSLRQTVRSPYTPTLPVFLDWTLLPRVGNLYLSGRACQHLFQPKELPILSRLVQLELCNCRLPLSPQFFRKHYPHLKQLDLRGNEILAPTGNSPPTECNQLAEGIFQFTPRRKKA
ncbi:Leucine-rich repeat protein [Dispira parvispora]|uniref:Leucine-rich repeat protein n=1 Tax=Dispira parvispora TaxID=1520584 RepID=A0A9W8AQU9_9FUNG|nr:Leucine-rich repeat protein [Dispira parvispora]